MFSLSEVPNNFNLWSIKLIGATPPIISKKNIKVNSLLTWWKDMCFFLVVWLSPVFPVYFGLAFVDLGTSYRLFPDGTFVEHLLLSLDHNLAEVYQSFQRHSWSPQKMKNQKQDLGILYCTWFAESHIVICRAGPTSFSGFWTQTKNKAIQSILY